MPASYSDILGMIREYDGDILEATPVDILPVLAPVHSVIASECSPTQTGSSDLHKNVKFVYALARESLMAWASASRYDQWCLHECDDVILTTKRSSRGSSNESYDLHDSFHKFLDKELKGLGPILVSQSPSNDNIGLLNDVKSDYELTSIILPRSSNSSTVNLQGCDWNTYSRLFDREPGEAITLDGVVVGKYRKSGNHKIIVLRIAGPFNTSGRLVEDDFLWDSFARILRRVISAADDTVDTAVEDTPSVTTSERELYSLVETGLKIIQRAYRDNRSAMRALQSKIDEDRSTINSCMDTIANKNRDIVKNSSRLRGMREGFDVGFITDLLRDVDKISRDRPVKSITPLSNGRLGWEIRLHPVVLDIGDDAEHYDMEYILCDDIVFDFTPTRDGNCADVIRFHSHDHDGEDIPPHPHAYASGGACWGTAAGEIALAVSEYRWHELMQWLYSWAGAYNAGDTTVEPTYFEEATGPAGWRIPTTVNA